MSGDHTPVERCRVCASAELERFLDLGATPLANRLVTRERLREPEPTFPLAAVRCHDCGLVQLSVVVDPEIMFRDYLYASSASRPLLAHFDSYAADVVGRFAPSGSLVVEIGSNDGVLLRPLSSRGARVIGVEPAANLARVANDAGLETWNDFFDQAVADRIRSTRGAASAVVANNVLAHIHDLAGVVHALDRLLADDGVFVAEFPYLVDLLEHVEYDTIYHEHLSYFRLAPLARLFEPAGLELFDVRRLPIHGGSVRVFVGRRGRHEVTAALRAGEALERGLGLDSPEPYARFASRVVASRRALRTMLAELRDAGKRVAALGATAKGNTLLNYCGIGPDQVAYVADSTPLKHGLYTPGAHLPVRPEDTIRTDRPDCTLLLAWNYADSILERFQDYVRAGGRFIHPIPLARPIPA